MLSEYIPIFILVLVAILMTLILVFGTTVFGPQNPNPVKRAPYESGILPEVENLLKERRFPIQFYMVAMLFIIFDIEAVFTFPWALALRQLGWFGVFSMAEFMVAVLVVYYYVIRKGGLDWEETEDSLIEAHVHAQQDQGAI